jgi:hypothetical protein
VDEVQSDDSNALYGSAAVVEASVSPRKRGAEITVEPKEKLTPALLEQKVWEIWGYVRQHAQSLDSERHCNWISAKIQGIIEQFSLERKALEAALKQLQADYRKSKAEHGRMLKLLKDSDIPKRQYEDIRV